MELQRKLLHCDPKLLHDSTLTAADIRVYLTLCSFVSKSSIFCFPSYATIANMTGLTRRSVMRSMASLTEKHYAVKESNVGRKSNRYFLPYYNKAVADVYSCDAYIPSDEQLKYFSLLVEKDVEKGVD